MRLTLKQRIFSLLLLGWLGWIQWDPARGSGFDLAETAATLRLWHAVDGLPSEAVTAILQTRDGFLWVGTRAGLVRFDGVKFTGVKLGEAATNNPVPVTALCEGSDGTLWIGSQQDGLFRLAAGKILNYSRAQGLLDAGVTSLAASQNGNLWVGTKSGLNRWTGAAFQAFTRRDGLTDAFVSGVNVARSGTVWITTRAGMCRYVDGHITPYELQTDSQGRRPEYLGVYEDRRGNFWAFGDTYLINLAEGKRFNYFRSSESASIRIWSLCEGRDGRLWIGTSGRGLFCFEGNSFQPVILGENRWSYDVRAICEDHEGNLWLGTSGGGLVQLRPQSMQVLQAGLGLPAERPTALAQDDHGRVYVGLPRMGLYASASGRFDRVGAGLTGQSFITSVCAAPDGTVWAGTLGDGLHGWLDRREMHLTTANGLADNAVLAVCADRQGAVWASTRGGGVQRLDCPGGVGFEPRQGWPGTAVTALLPAAAGGVWMGTQDGQLWRAEKGGCTNIATTLTGGHYPVLALAEGKGNRLWVGTAGGGLAGLTAGGMVVWNTHNGLPADVVAGVAEDPANNLWLATSAGIYRINHNDLRQAGEHPAMAPAAKLMADARVRAVAGDILGGACAVLAPDGELWFATAEGVLNVNTRQSEFVPAEFPVYLESVAANGQPAVALLHGPLWSPDPDAAARFVPPEQINSLEFHFTALSYVAPEDIQFRHKLEGSDLDWVSDGGSRSVRYGRVPSGKYRLRVAARTAGGGWQEAGESLALVVPTPLYYQTWALCLYALAAVGLVAGIVRVVSHRRLRFTLARLEQQQSLERERLRIARDLHDEMGSKLTKISFLSEHAQVDAQAAGPLADKIESIARTSRDLLKTMDEIVWVVNPHNDTLENLASYLSYYAVEYFQNTSLECELRLPSEIPPFALSSELRHHLFLTFEEALNNVLKHSAATHVIVEMKVAGREFELSIQDNGRGFTRPGAAPVAPALPGGRGGNGLKNMGQRLAALGGHCRVTSQPGAGTTVTLQLRLNPKPPGEV